MDPLSVTASVIAVLQLTNKAISWITKIKNASKDQEECKVELSSLSRLLTSLNLQINGANHNEPWYREIKTLDIRDGLFDQYKRALEELQAIITPKNILTRSKKLVAQNFTNEKAKNILEKIERLKTLVNVALEMDHLKLSLALKNGIEVLHKENRAIKDDTTVIRHFVTKNSDDKLIEWLSPSNYPSRQSDIIAQRQGGTGEWFLASQEFRDWTSYPKQTLFCPGAPGAGKTMLSAIAIDHLLKASYGIDIGVACIYCDYKVSQDQTSTALLAALLKQLVRSRLLVSRPVRELYDRHTRQETRPSFAEVRDTLCLVLSEFSSTYVVVDALDECFDQNGTCRTLINELRSLQAKTDLRLMFTSRSIPEIEQHFTKVSRIEVRAVPADIRNFVIGQIDGLPKCVRDDNTLLELVLAKISEAANGMFLLVRLCTNFLQDKYTRREVKNALQQFALWSKRPKLTNQVYDVAYKETLNRVESQSPGAWKLAKAVLSWMVHAKRHLTATELCHALAVEAGHLELDYENIPSIEDIVSVCIGLVIVEKNSNVVRLTHYTTQEYLDRACERWIPGAQIDIASTCLTFLAFESEKFTSTHYDDEDRQISKREEFLDYAIQFWAQHTLPVQEEMAELAYTMLKSSNLSLCAAPVLLKLPDYGRHDLAGVTSLHLTAYYGLSNLFAGLLRDLGAEASDQMNFKDGCGRSPLHWAACGGPFSTLWLSPTRFDVDAKIRDEGDRGILSAATQTGRAEVVKELITRFPRLLDQADMYGCTALSLAAEMDQSETAKLLLDLGANISTIDNERKGVLHHAISNYRRSLSLIEMLLHKGAPFDQADINNMTPLHIAVQFSLEEVVALFLRNRVPVDLKVHRRAYIPKPKTSIDSDSLVYDLEPCLNVTNAEGGLTVLHFSALAGNKEMTEFLLSMDADPNVLSEHGETPLQLARTQETGILEYADGWTDDYYRAEHFLPFLDEKLDDVDGVLNDVAVSRVGVIKALLGDPRIRITDQERIDSEIMCKDYMSHWKQRQITLLNMRRYQEFFPTSSDEEY